MPNTQMARPARRFSRKQYGTIAEIFKDAIGYAARERAKYPFSQRKFDDWSYRTGAWDTLRSLETQFVLMFSRDNPNFDQNAFYRVIYSEETQQFIDEQAKS